MAKVTLIGIAKSLILLIVVWFCFDKEMSLATLLLASAICLDALEYSLIVRMLNKKE